MEDENEMSEIKKKNSGQFQKGNTVGTETRFKNNNGAAVKYKDEFCDLMELYFQEQESKVIYEKEYFKDGTLKKEIPKMIIPQKYPTFEAFAVSIGVTSRTLREWADVGEDGKAKHPRFSAAYARAKEMQLAIAKNNGITKQYDSNFAKFVLINDHDMTDKVVQEQSQKKPFEVNINVVKKV
jgi:hypothetical protein